MIEVRYLDRLGNNLFQYCFGRILAEKLGYCLKADPIPGFPHTKAVIQGADYSRFPEELLLAERSNPVERQKIDLKAVAEDPRKRKIVVEGYFQRYEYFQSYKDHIRKDWLKIEPAAPFPIEKEDVVCHVRRDDYARSGTAHDFSYYEKAIEACAPKRIFLCTDDSQDPFLDRFQKFHAVLSPAFLDPLQDFKFMMSFNQIILSASTFSWWAAFLSKAKVIYFPISAHGYWSEEFPDIDLRVCDESRYRPIVCEARYRRTIREVVSHHAIGFGKKVQSKFERLLQP